MKTKFLFAVVFALSSLFAKSQIAVVYPNDGGDTLRTGQYHTIQWNGSLDSTKLVKIELYSSISLTWVTWADTIPDKGFRNIYLDHVPTQTAKIRITRLDNPAITDESDGFFHIIKSPIVVTAGADDTICLNDWRRLNASFTSGIPPYSFNWSPSSGLNDSTSINPFANPTSTTTYTLTVKDAVGDSGTAQVTIYVKQNLAPRVDSIVTTNLICPNVPTGSACAFVSGGTPPYTYDWGDSIPTSNSCISNRFSGYLSVKVKDASGCKAPDTLYANISQPIPLYIQFVKVSDGSLPDTIIADVTGGTPPYSYAWSNQTTSSSINIQQHGTYQITVLDSKNCTAVNSVVSSVYVAVDDTFYLCSTSSGASSFNLNIFENDDMQLGDSITIDSLSGVQGASYTLYYTGGKGLFNLELANQFPLGSNYTFYYTARSKYSGNTSVATVTLIVDNSNQCVWPGDADYDGVVDNNDLLVIGQAYGAKDSLKARIYPSNYINWYAYQAINWNDSLNDTLNYKHIDCDGNGTINANDTLAIIQNYNKTHPRSGGRNPHRANTPELAITLSADSLTDGQIVSASLALGSNTQLANNVYGIAFTFNYDANVVDTTQVGFVVNDNSWLCNNAGDHISINKKFTQGGKIAVGITRIDKATRSGSGEIATAILKITTGNINGKDLSYYQLNTYISDVRAVDNAGNIMDINEGFDSAAVAFTPTGIREVALEQNKVLLYPNPATNSIRFSLQNGSMEGWEIVSVEGKVMASETFHPDSYRDKTWKVYNADISQLAKGVYFLKVNTKAGAVHARFLKE